MVGRCWSSLWKRRGHGRVEHDVPFGLLHYLVDVSVENRHRSKALKVTESLRAIFGSPAPFGINRPKRNVRENDYRPARGLGLEVRFQPLELVSAELTEAFECGHVAQPHEMDVLVVETVPAASFRFLAVALEVLFAIIDGSVMLTRHEERLLRLRAFEYLVQSVVFARLRRVTQVACMNNEVGLLRQCVDFVYGRLQRAHDVRVSRLVETHVSVADLDEVEFSLSGLRLLAESPRTQDAAANRPDNACSGPSHAL